MKKLSVITIVVSALILSAFRTTPVYVSGKLVMASGDKKGKVFEVIVKGDETIVAKTNTKSNGEFELSFTPANEKYFDFFFIDPRYKSDTVFLRSYSKFESKIVKATFYGLRHHVDDDNHVVCPKCGQSGEVNRMNTKSEYYYCSKDKIKF